MTVRGVVAYVVSHRPIPDLDADELEWYVPSGIAISELQRIHDDIKRFLQTPIDLDGKKASELLSKKRRRRRRRSPSPVSDNDAVVSDDERRRKKRERKKEKEVYKSAQFIEDSDEEYGDMDAFLEKEKAQREKTSLAAAANAGIRLPTMKATGTKKRRRNAEGKKIAKSKKPERSPTSDDSSGPSHRNNVESDGSDVEIIDMSRPRPRPLTKLTKRRPSSPPPSSEPDDRPVSLSPPGLSEEESVKPSQRSKRVILSDDDE